MALVLVGVSALADLFVSIVAISYFGITGELNPLAHVAYTNFGIYGLVMMKVIVTELVAIAATYRLGQIAAGFAIGLWTFGAFTGCLSLLLVS